MARIATTARVARVRSALAGQREHLIALVRRHAGASVDADEVVQVAAQRALSRAEHVSAAARELGLSANNAMVRLHRARKALRGRMAEHSGTTSTTGCSDCGCQERGCCPAP